MSDSFWPHGLQHSRLLCPLLSSGVCSDSCPLNWWCYLNHLILYIHSPIYPSMHLFIFQMLVWHWLRKIPWRRKSQHTPYSYLKTPWTEEPAERQSIGSQRVKHAWATEHICKDTALPRWQSGKESACQWGRRKRHKFNPWVGKSPWSRKWQSTPVFLPGKSLGQRSLTNYSP